MRKIIAGCAALSFLLAGGVTAAGDYEFYKGCQYPGKDLRPGVGVNKVIDPGGKPTEYARRTVQWWPRKGHDAVTVESGMPLRTWTFQDANHPFSEYGTLKAHLLGFRGVGGPGEPCVVLRLPDGRKRMFPRGTFADKDRTFIMDVFAKEMKRICAAAPKVKYETRKDLDRAWPNNAKPGEPGTMQVETEHITWASGSQSSLPHEPWIHEADLARGKRYRDEVMEWSENMWRLYEYSGLLMHGWDRKKQYKYLITVPGTKRDGFKDIGGYAGGGYGGCGIKGASTGLLAHEWGHGIRINSSYVGGGEAGADTCATFSNPGPRGNHQTRRPARHVFSGIGGYGVTTLYNVVGDNPNWGYGWSFAMPVGKDDSEYTLLTIARVGEQRGLFDNGIRGLGDLMGEYAARVATFDCELEYSYRQGLFSPVRHWLEPVDAAKRIYRITSDYAPEPYGVNNVRLVPDEGATEIAVDFRGLHDPDAYSDWRACIVSVGVDGIRRYSLLWNKGRMSASIKKDDVSHWLTVAATPTAMYLPRNRGKRNLGLFCSGRHAWRYPWQAQFTNARPGRPHWSAADFGAREPSRRWIAPAVPGSQAAAYLKREVERLTAMAGRAKDGKAKRGAAAEAERIRNELKAMAKGKRHANGGGWVADSATVEPTAYVGPNAMVLDSARVLGHAGVEGFAVVRESACVQDYARVFGAATVEGNGTVVGGYTRAWLANRRGSAPEKSSRGHAGATYPVMPLRTGSEELRTDGLWIHYSMDAPNNITLEDSYRYRADFSHGHNRALVPANDGYVRNGPECVEVGGRLGLRFDGRKQYAELNPRAVDLGEATLVATVRREAKAPGVILDCGVSGKNCMVLRLERDGTPVFEATVDGKTDLTLTGKTAVPLNQWARLRVELDGSAASLWVDKEVVARKDSDFRPCHVFPPDTPRFNTLAVSRSLRDGFAGVFDSLAVYHKVHADFEKLGPPPTDSPIRPSKAVVERIEKKMGDARQVQEKIREMIREEMAPYEAMSRKCQARMSELLGRDAGLRRAREALAAAKREGVETTRVNELAKQVSEAEEDAWKRYGLEQGWLQSFSYAAFRGHYNTPYKVYVELRARAAVGGGEMRESTGLMREAFEGYSDPTNWRTKVDWDWRMPEEIDGKIDSLPLMKQWLARTRGPVVKTRPTTTKQ